MTGSTSPKSKVSDADYKLRVEVGGRMTLCPIYCVWYGVYSRCNSKKTKESCPTYSDVFLHDEWKSFMKFRSWFISNYKDGYFIDKDLLVVGNRCYGPDVCVFVPRWLNNFTETRLGARNGVMIGACWHHEVGKFAGRCNNPITGKGEHLGLFVNEIDAHNAWLSRKLDLAFQLKDKMDEIDERIYGNVVEIIINAK